MRRLSGLGLGRELGLGLGLLGLLFGVWQCSFSLPERTICTDLGCVPTGDGGTPDMAKDPNDPAATGSFKIATLAVSNVPPAIQAQVLLGPSDDNVTISTRQTVYPLILIAPASSLSATIDTMRPYADRLVTHGFIVAIFKMGDESNHQQYVADARAYLDFIYNNTDAAIKSRIDIAQLGLLGFELGAKISGSMALVQNQSTQDPRVKGLFLIDPADLAATIGQVSGISDLGQVSLPGGGSIAILREPNSVLGTSACVAPEQISAVHFYEATRSPALCINFVNANVGDFAAGFGNPQCTGGTAAAQTQSLAVKYATAYFQWTLKGITRSREYLLGADFQADAPAVSLNPAPK